MPHVRSHASPKLALTVNRTVVLTALLSLLRGFAGSTLAISLLLPSVVEAQAGELRADGLLINNAAGGDRVRLKGSPGPAEGAVQLIDVTGKPRIGVEMGGPDGTIPNAFGFHLRTQDGTIIGNLGVVNDGSGLALTLGDQQGRRRINLLVDSDGMQLLDADGNVTWSAP